ncbi:MAG: FtsX-like permease family protein, partial [Cyanobacteria bacterium P01_F01_bin.53]
VRDDGVGRGGRGIDVVFKLGDAIEGDIWVGGDGVIAELSRDVLSRIERVHDESSFNADIAGVHVEDVSRSRVLSWVCANARKQARLNRAEINSFAPTGEPFVGVGVWDRGPEEAERSFATADIGIVKLSPDVQGEQAVRKVVKTLDEALPEDVLVLPKDGPDGFVNRERKYWQDNTNIGFVFSLLTTMSFFVGIILVYQILYTDVADHWAEYATLKAMGYTNTYLLSVVIQEALLLSVLGFIPGFAVSYLMYTGAANLTGLFFQMTVERVVNLFTATLVMCIFSGAIAVRKVQSTDPAEVFGG